MISVKIPLFKYKDTVVLKDINLEFEVGKTHGIIGLNGAGKTTFFNLLSGQLKSNGCTFVMEEKSILRKDISHIDTDPFFFKNLTAREFLSVFETKSDSYKEEKLCELLKIPLDQLIEEYSTGMKKKLLLVSQIKQNKSIFILDEPFNGLDLETNKTLELIVSTLNERGKTVFMSSHILSPLLNTCYKIFLLKDKTIHKTYDQHEFSSIEQDLFGDYSKDLKKELKEMI